MVVTESDLSAPFEYAGILKGPMIRFRRDGKALSARRGSGSETGFQYLADKQGCLIVIAGQKAIAVKALFFSRRSSLPRQKSVATRARHGPPSIR